MRLRRMRKIAATIKAPMTAMPPTTPPTIAPMGVDFLALVDSGGVSPVARGSGTGLVDETAAEEDAAAAEEELSALLELALEVLRTEAGLGTYLVVSLVLL